MTLVNQKQPTGSLFLGNLQKSLNISKEYIKSEEFEDYMATNMSF